MGRPLDGRADQYALAATAYHLLTGAPLFPHSNAAVVIGKHLNAQPPPLTDRHPELAPLDAVLSKALAKDPTARFVSCMDFARALGSSATWRPTPPVSAPTMPQFVQHGASNTGPSRIALAAAAAFVVLCVAAYVGLKAVSKPTPAEAFTLTGTVHLTGNSTSTVGLPSGFRCAGAQNFADIGPGTPVIVADEAGKLLAKGTFDSSYLVRDSCNLRFSISDVPGGAKFYRVQVAGQRESTYTEAEARAGAEISFASSEPSSSATPTPTTTRTPTTTSSPRPTPTTVDSETAALNRLRAIADGDRSSVSFYLAERWVAQISSKYYGLVAEGTTWDYAKILQEHLQLRQIYPGVRLLYSPDWSTFDTKYQWWVTVVGISYTDSRDAKAWCAARGFDRNHCFAKLISTTHPVEGSTDYNP